MNLKVGIAGLRRGKVYIGCFESLENVVITALCDKDEILLKKICKEKKVKGFTDYKDFLKSDIDIVVVAVPVPLHADFSISAMENNKHVLCEVPPVNSVEEAR